VIHLPLNSSISVPGQELVQFSRAKSLSNIAIGNKYEELVTDKLLKIGKNKGNETRKEFFQCLQQKEQATLAYYHDAISKLHHSEGQEPCTFEGGCDFLLDWYRSKI
jgi:hypothetical protein